MIRGGVDHGTFVSAAAFSSAGGIEVRWDAASHQLQVDLNGDGQLGATDLVVAGQSLAGLTAHDLLFVYREPAVALAGPAALPTAADSEVRKRPVADESASLGSIDAPGIEG